MKFVIFLYFKQLIITASIFITFNKKKAKNTQKKDNLPQILGHKGQNFHILLSCFLDKYCSDNILNMGAISCGNHYATSCSKCPCNYWGVYVRDYRNVRDPCRGDCQWVGPRMFDKCEEKRGKKTKNIIGLWQVLCMATEQEESLY